MEQKTRISKQVPVRMPIEIYNKFAHIADRDGLSFNFVLLNLIKSYIAEYESNPTTPQFKVVRGVENQPRTNI